MKSILLAILMAFTATVALAQSAPQLSSWQIACNLPNGTPAQKVARAIAMTSEAVTTENKLYAFEGTVRATSANAGVAAAQSLDVPAGLTIAPGLIKFWAGSDRDWALAEVGLREYIATNPYNKTWAQGQLLRSITSQRKDATADALALINTTSFGENVSLAQSCWNALNRSTMTKADILTVIDKLILTIDVTPKSVTFLGMLKSNRDMLSQ
jgi:hypothetical protein